MKKGTWLAIGAYLIWGLVPAFWSLLNRVDAVEILIHRVLWSFIILSLVMIVRNQWKDFRIKVFKRRVLIIYFMAAVLIGLNWLTYVWAVTAKFIVETSLGYFINPLLSILMGVVLLRERIRAFQWVPIGLAAAGVFYLTFGYGELPWIALVLAFTFALYGLVKKLAPLNAQYGLTLETGMMFFPALGVLLYTISNEQNAFLQVDAATDLLMVLGGVVTVVPLLMFAAAARLVPLSKIGVLQFLAPAMQFLIGVLVYHEPFTWEKSIGFIIIWIALILYAVEGGLNSRKKPSSGMDE